MPERLDAITREVVFKAPIDRVWDALTAPEEVARWFGDIAEIELRPGGKAKFGWTEFGDSFEAVVVEVDEPTRFSYSWSLGSNTTYDESAARLVEINLVAEGDSTRMTLVESGFSSLSEDQHRKQFGENSAGWDSELSDLVAYLAVVATS